MLTRVCCFHMGCSLMRHRRIICIVLRIFFFSATLYLVRDFYNFYLSDGHVLPFSNDQILPAKEEDNLHDILYLPTVGFPEVPKHISDERTGDTIVKLTEEEFFEKVHSQNGGVTQDPVDFKSIDICVDDSKCLPFDYYITWRAENLARIVNHHLDQNRITPTLKPYPEDMQRPDPLLMVKDKSMTIDEELIRKQLKQEKERRMKLGDDDLLKFAEIKKAMRLEKGAKIPNIIHFIWFGCRVFKVHHYISMLSALRFQKPDLILFHTNCVPNGTYWRSLFDTAGETLLIVRRSPPQEIFGKKFLNVEHQSDVARLQILLEVGGIYMDDDIYILKSLDELRIHDMVLGEENYDALANSVILASKDSWFLRRWYHEYQNFNGSRWSDSSCFVPWALWRFFPVTISVIKEKMLRPNWEEIDYIYLDLWDWSKSYTIHLFSRYMENVDGTEERTLEEIAVLNTTYGEISRHVIWGDHHIRSPEDLFHQILT